MENIVGYICSTPWGTVSRTTPSLAWEALADYCLEHSDELDELAHTGTAWAGYPDDWAAASDELMDELLGVLL